jgi:hypothetical protein
MDRTVGVGCVVACLLWAAVGTLMGLSWAFDHPRLGQTGLAASVLAGTMTVRCVIVRQGKAVRNAFELGQDAARVRHLR